MHLILNDGSGIPLNTKSKRKILIKAALVYKPHWGSSKKKVTACSPEFTVFISKSISQKTRERAKLLSVDLRDSTTVSANNCL